MAISVEFVKVTCYFFYIVSWHVSLELYRYCYCLHISITYALHWSVVKQMKISIKSYRWPKGIIFGNLCFNVIHYWEITASFLHKKITVVYSKITEQVVHLNSSSYSHPWVEHFSDEGAPKKLKTVCSASVVNVKQFLVSCFPNSAGLFIHITDRLKNKL